jgi:hypothetical protein
VPVDPDQAPAQPQELQPLRAAIKETDWRSLQPYALFSLLGFLQALGLVGFLLVPLSWSLNGGNLALFRELVFVFLGYLLAMWAVHLAGRLWERAAGLPAIYYIIAGAAMQLGAAGYILLDQSDGWFLWLIAVAGIGLAMAGACFLRASFTASSRAQLSVSLGAGLALGVLAAFVIVREGQWLIGLFTGGAAVLLLLAVSLRQTPITPASVALPDQPTLQDLARPPRLYLLAISGIIGLGLGILVTDFLVLQWWWLDSFATPLIEAGLILSGSAGIYLGPKALDRWPRKTVLIGSLLLVSGGLFGISLGENSFQLSASSLLAAFGFGGSLVLLLGMVRSKGYAWLFWTVAATGFAVSALAGYYWVFEGGVSLRGLFLRGAIVNLLALPLVWLYFQKRAELGDLQAMAQAEQ